MKKTLLSALLVLVILFSFISGAFAAANITTIKAILNKSTKINYNGLAFNPKDSKGAAIYPIVYNGRIYVPLKPFCDIAGINLANDSKNNAVNLSKVDKNVVKKTEQSSNNVPDKSTILDNNKNDTSNNSDDNKGDIPNNSASVTSSNAKEFTDGIIITGDVPRDGITPKDFNVKVDRNKIPTDMKNFTKISVWGTDDISAEGISGLISQTQKYRYGLQTYDEEKGFGEYNKGPYNVVILFDDSVNPLGYYIIK